MDSGKGLYVMILPVIVISAVSGAQKEPARLAPLALEPLPIGAITAEGWLQRQLRIQAEGLSGNLEKFWLDIQDSGWIGGKAEGWERAPYWLDGMVPLAWTLNDDVLKADVKRWMDYILEHQHEDGWLGPRKSAGYRDLDPWPQFVILKALRQYNEASGDPRVVPAMLKNVRCIDAVLRETPLFDWGKYRWMDLVITVHWLHEHTGEAWLLDVAAHAHEQGFNWRDHFENFKYPEKMKREECILDTHVVNNAMAVKAPGAWYRQSRDAADAGALDTLLGTLDKYHGQITGILTGDEHYAGKSPSQGTELCAVVEYMFSLETMIAAFGRADLADRLERIAFNALPGTFSPDMWAHQYVQQANQVVCRVSDDRVYTNNGPDANLFGLEPNYGCCTANMHQGWPKFAAHCWMRMPPKALGMPTGLAAVAYAPCLLNTEVNGKPVRVRVETDYPFRDTVQVTITADGEFPVAFRIPGWSQNATLQIGEETAVPVETGAFHTLFRVWHGDTTVILRFPMTAKVERRFNNSAAVSRGPLVYSLHIGAEWKHLLGESPHSDFEVLPTTPWNYALELDGAAPESSFRFEELPVGDNPFDPATLPVRAFVKGRLLPGWDIEHNVAAPPPQSPVISTEPLTELELIPYGCAKLRVTEFPVLAE